MDSQASVGVWGVWAGHQGMCRGGGVPVQSVRGRAARVGGWHRSVRSVVAGSAIRGGLALCEHSQLKLATKIYLNI